MFRPAVAAPVIEDGRKNHSSARSTANNGTPNSTGGSGSGGDHRKVAVDTAFEMLLKKVRKNRPLNSAASASAPALTSSSSTSNLRYQQHTQQNHHHHHHYHQQQVDYGDHDNASADDNDDDEDARGRSSDDDANSENLGDFSGLEDLMGEAEDGITTSRTGGGKRKYAPNGRKNRGYHKWAGRRVALLATGETGVVIKRPGGRIKVRLDISGREISSSEDKLHLIESRDPHDAIDEIYEASRFVPQWHDIVVDSRVAMLRFGNATGRIIRKPDEERALSGLGHAVVKLDCNGEEKKAVIETLRLIGPEHVMIAYSDPQKQLGRPTKASVARKMVTPPVHAILPPSKSGRSGDDWRSKLRAPTGHDSPPQSPEHFESAPKSRRTEVSEEDDTRRKRKTDTAATYVEKRSPKKSKATPVDADSPNKPVLNRGQKLCRSCGSIIGTASRICSHCKAECPKTNAKNG